jgi:hypothetical protein
MVLYIYICALCCCCPTFTLVVVLSTLVVESVRDLVADDPADAAVVHVGRSVRLEKITLKEDFCFFFVFETV